MYKIVLSDGTVIDNLSMNGNNFVSESKLTEEEFEGKLSSVVIIDPDGNEEHHENMELVQIVNTDYTDGKWYFVLRELTEDELWRAKMQGDMLYLSMMTDIEL